MLAQLYIVKEILKIFLKKEAAVVTRQVHLILSCMKTLMNIKESSCPHTKF